MKKTCAIIVFCLLLATGTAWAKMLSVAGEKVNLRAKPSAKSAILWEYGKGFPVRVLDRKGNWYKVIDFENDTGWVYKKLMGDTPHMIVKKKRVNIRSGPGSRYKLVGKANYGVVFKTIEQRKGWAKVRHESGLTGWIRRDLLWGW